MVLIFERPDNVKGLIEALTRTLHITLEAHAEMYSRIDGPWMDELIEAAVACMLAEHNLISQRALGAVVSMLVDFRRTLSKEGCEL